MQIIYIYIQIISSNKTGMNSLNYGYKIKVWLFENMNIKMCCWKHEYQDLLYYL